MVFPKAERVSNNYELLFAPHWCQPLPRLSNRGGPERMGPRPPLWVPLLKHFIMVAVSFPPV